MDVFLEQLVVKKKTGMDILKIVGLILATIIVVFLAFFVLPRISRIFSTFGVFIVVGALYGAWYLITGLNVEYEYILTNGEIDVDKIIAQRKRKRLITVNTRNFSEFGLYRPEEHTGKSYDATIFACSSLQDPNLYYAVTEHPKYGNCMLVFNPDERIVENAKQFMKRNVVK